MGTIDQPQLDRVTVEGLVQLARDLSHTDDLPTMLSIFVAALTDVAGFGCAAINLVRDDGDLQVVAVAGPPDIEKTLMGVVDSRRHWDTELAGGQRHGAVQLHLNDSVDHTFSSWVSDDQEWFSRTADDPQAWRPSYAVYVPIWEPDGSLLGVVSVDMPRSGRIPDQQQCATLEILARQAGAAIASARTSAPSAFDESIFGLVFEVAGAPMCVIGEGGRFVHANRRFRDTFGAVSEVSAFNAAVTAVEDAESLQASVEEIFSGRTGESTFVICCDVDGEIGCFQVTLRGAAYASTAPARVVCTFTDITKERRARDQHRHDAEHDQLTGLLNRRGLRGAVDGVVEHLLAEEVLVAIYCDLDGFKQANDLHGHLFGDGVLIETAGLLRTAVAEPAVVGRVGGDEFVIVAACASRHDGLAIADLVVKSLDLQLPGTEVHVTVSVGVSICPPGSRGSVGDLMQTADEALYEAKIAGGARWVLAKNALL